MPNWCENALTVEGSEERVKEFDGAFFGRRALWPLQAYEVSNRTPEQVAKIERERLEMNEEQMYCLNALYPVPAEVLSVGYSAPLVAETSVPARMARLFDPEKWSDGYSWCTSHWGTKWDASIEGGIEGEGHAFYTFDTAWSPPLPWLDKVAADWPDLTFTIEYSETGMGFAGLTMFVGGECTEDTQVDSGNDPDVFREFMLHHFGYDPYDDCEVREA